MRAITVNVSEQVYEEFQIFARKTERTTSELIREAMEEYRQHRIQRKTSLFHRQPASVGGPFTPLTRDDDLLNEMRSDP